MLRKFDWELIRIRRLRCKYFISQTMDFTKNINGLLRKYYILIKINRFSFMSVKIRRIGLLI